MRFAILAVVLASAACKHTPDHADCAAQAEEVGRFLHQMDHDQVVYLNDDLQPPLRSDVTDHGDAAPTVQVYPDRVMYQGEAVDRDKLEQRLRAARKRLLDDIEAGRVRGKVDDTLVNLVVDARTPYANVAGVTHVVYAAGFTTAAFAFRRPPATPPPPRTRVDDDLEALKKQPVGATAPVADYIVKRLAPCKPLHDAFTHLSFDERDKGQVIIDAVEPALKACGCAIDPHEVRSALWQIAGNPRPVAFVRVTLDEAAPVLPPATTWGEASKQLQPGRSWLD